MSLRRQLLGLLPVAVALAGCGKSGVERGASPLSPASSSASGGFAGGVIAAAAGKGLGGRCTTHMRLHVARRLHIGTGAGALASDGGALWVARPAAGTVTRIGSSGSKVLHLGETPVSLSLGYGRLWVALRDANQVASLNALTLGGRRDASLPLPVGVLAAKGVVWVLSLDSGALYPLDPSSGGAGEPVYSPVRDPVAMALARSELWLLGAHEGGLSPVNSDLHRIVRAGFDLPARALRGLSATGSTVWLGEPGRRALLRIDAETVHVSELRAPAGLAPSATAAGSCGLWVADADGRLTLADPRSATALSAPIRTGRSIAALASVGAGVWASDPVDGTVVYVNPEPGA